MGQELARVVTDPLARVLTSFNDSCFGTGCESDCNGPGCGCHLMTRAKGETENEETEEKDDDCLHSGEQ